MPKFVVENTIKMLIKAGNPIKDSKVLIMGITFKENIPDIRNSKVVDIYKELKEYGINVYVYDPHAYKDEVKKEYGIDLIDNIKAFSPYDAIIVAVKHDVFKKEYTLDKLEKLYNPSYKKVLIDVKGLYDKNEAINKNFLYWRL